MATILFTLKCQAIKTAIFKLGFQANYWTNQLETNASNSGRTEVFEETSIAYEFLVSEAPS